VIGVGFYQVAVDAIQAGATRPELLETIGVGVMMAGGPGTIYAAHALDAVEQFLAEPPAVSD
jgi:alkylhydroperoxidase/carboxymuconolactone decarboxylase family protein YurZ